MNDIQSDICERFGTKIIPSEPHLKLGLALATLSDQPINGLRHTPDGDTTGWYVWGGGEISSEDNFFQPVHIAHLDELFPSIIPYLGLPPGWRFQIAEGHEDVWFDSGLVA